MRRQARLVTRILSAGQTSKVSATTLAAERTCSKLSRTSRKGPESLSCSAICSGRVQLLTRWMSSASERAVSTRAGLLIEASPTNRTPAGNRRAAARVIATARRVFPAPPGPVRVSSRTSGRSSNSVPSATSRSRPISEVRATGRSLRFLGIFAGGASPRGSENTSEAAGSTSFEELLTTGAPNRYPRRGTVFSNFCAWSPSARRNSTVHCTRESSVTNASGHTACINSSFPISLPWFSTRYFRVS